MGECVETVEKLRFVVYKTGLLKAKKKVRQAHDSYNKKRAKEPI